VHQTQALLRQLGYQHELYNAALEERVGVWKWERRSVNYVDQCRTLTGLGDLRPEVVASGVTLCRGTLKRLDRVFAAFYRRVKRGATPGFPRFKSALRFNSLQWEDVIGWKVKVETRRLYLLGIGDIKANYHRPLQGAPKAITVKREGTKWWLSVRCVDVPAMPLAPHAGKWASILGLRTSSLRATESSSWASTSALGLESNWRRPSENCRPNNADQIDVDARSKESPASTAESPTSVRTRPTG
jgi:putative transposase